MFEKTGFKINGNVEDKLQVIRKFRGFSQENFKAIIDDTVLMGSLPKAKKDYVFLNKELISYNPKGGKKVN